MCRLRIDEFAFEKHAPRKRTSPGSGGGCGEGGGRPSKVTPAYCCVVQKRYVHIGLSSRYQSITFMGARNTVNTKRKVRHEARAVSTD